jgi:hypothetical protein
MQIVTQSIPLADDVLVAPLDAAPDAMVCTAARRTGLR